MYVLLFIYHSPEIIKIFQVLAKDETHARMQHDLNVFWKLESSVYTEEFGWQDWTKILFEYEFENKED